jgi:hypothetical protein
MCPLESDIDARLWIVRICRSPFSSIAAVDERKQQQQGLHVLPATARIVRSSVNPRIEAMKYTQFHEQRFRESGALPSSWNVRTRRKPFASRGASILVFKRHLFCESIVRQQLFAH